MPEQESKLIPELPKDLTGLLATLGVKTPEQMKKEKERADVEKQQQELFTDKLNTMYQTDYGKLIICSFVQYSRYWENPANFAPHDKDLLKAQQEMVYNCIIKRLNTSNLTDLINQTKKES